MTALQLARSRSGGILHMESWPKPGQYSFLGREGLGRLIAQEGFVESSPVSITIT